MFSVVIYIFFLNGCDKMGRRLEMFVIFDEVIVLGIELDSIMYSVIIIVFLKEGMKIKVFMFVDEMFVKNVVVDGCKLSILICWVLFFGFVKVGGMEVVEKVMENMICVKYIFDFLSVIELINEGIFLNERMEVDVVL